MSLRTQLSRWIDVRPGEVRLFLLSTLGAFLVLSFVVASRAVRDAFFLDEFSVEWLPQITVVVALSALPVVALFSRALAGDDPGRVYRRTLLLIAAGLVALQAFTDTRLPEDELSKQVATVGFYLWTALGTLLVTSGFWVVTAEHFALRDAKRLFAFISGGGTVGAMLTGLTLDPLAEVTGNSGLVIGITLTLVLLWVQQRALPAVPSHPESVADPEADRRSLRDSLRLIADTPHLRSIAAVVALATMASFTIDYQFKGAAELAFDNDEQLAGFFGQFYGVTGVLALLLQVLLASRLLTGAGVGPTLAVLPLTLLSGSTLMLFVPGLASATLVRGADNSLRRSIHRTVIEYLYVPVSPRLRRQTKPVIDSTVDSVAEGAAAVVVGTVVALGADMRGLSLLVAVLALCLLGMTRLMGRLYFHTLRERLQQRGEELEDETPFSPFLGAEATVTMTMTQFDIQSVLTQTGLLPATAAAPVRDAPAANDGELSLADRLSHSDPVVVSAALAETREWTTEHAPPLLRLLARDALSRRATDGLIAIGPAAVPMLAAQLQDESADFVIRRRIPRVLAGIDSPEAATALLDGLSAGRFEVRYRTGVALARRQKSGGELDREGQEQVWAATRAELARERPIWELQKLLDDRPASDELVTGRVYGRGELSLEHTFRLLSLVLEPDPVRTAFHGIVVGDLTLRSLALEYLEQVLPPDVKDRLWPFIGDLSEYQQQQRLRPMDEVVADLLKTGATLFAGELERERVREALREDED